MKRKLLSALLVAVLVLALFVPAAAASVADFTDVAQDAWYYSSVDYVAKKNYMNGTSATTFEPDSEMTRAMFVTVLSRMAGVKVNNDVESTFSDVDSDLWYTGAVVWATNAKIVEGYNGKFRPDDSITRQDIATMLVRYFNYMKLNLKKSSLIKSFVDADEISSYAVDAVEYCRSHGLLLGLPGGYFAPVKNATRAEVATMIARIVTIIEESGGSSVVNYDYTVKAAFSAKGYNLDLLAVYKNKTATWKVDPNTVAKDLIGGDNEVAIKNVIDSALAKAKNSSKTFEFGSKTLNVDIDADGVVTLSSSKDLAYYLAKYAEKEDAIIAKVIAVEPELAAYEAQLKALYESADPANMVSGNALLDADGYYSILSSIVDNACALRTALVGNTDLYDTAISKLNTAAGEVDVDISLISDLSAILSADKVKVNDYAGATIAEASASVDAAWAENAYDYATAKAEAAGVGYSLPETLSSVPSVIFGDYSFALTVERS